MVQSQTQFHVGHGTRVPHEQLRQRAGGVGQATDIRRAGAKGLGELLVEVLADGNAVAVLDGRQRPLFVFRSFY
jgi:hypothetical protein